VNVADSIRVVLGKIGLDGHDRGIRMVATWLRDGGMEVVYLGTHQTAERIAKAASEEDVDVIGLSFQGADHIPLCKQMVEQMKAYGLQDRLLIIGGNIPRADIPVLKEMGVDMIFPSGTSMSKSVTYIKENAGRKRDQEAR
jgi:methylmalonyl-CoA mutase C-terminal domain/subunit